MAIITLHFVDAAGSAARLQGETGQTLMQAAVAANLPGIAADCGGLMTCGTCHVFVNEKHARLLPLAQADELAMLDFTAVPRTPCSRLSCQIELTEALDGLTVDLPANQY